MRGPSDVEQVQDRSRAGFAMWKRSRIVPGLIWDVKQVPGSFWGRIHDVEEVPGSVRGKIKDVTRVCCVDRYKGCCRDLVCYVTGTLRAVFGSGKRTIG